MFRQCCVFVSRECYLWPPRPVAGRPSSRRSLHSFCRLMAVCPRRHNRSTAGLSSLVPTRWRATADSLPLPSRYPALVVGSVGGLRWGSEGSRWIGDNGEIKKQRSSLIYFFVKVCLAEFMLAARAVLSGGAAMGCLHSTEGGRSSSR